MRHDENTTKEITTKEITPWAHAAKLIREDLKRHFPGVTFAVKSRAYSGGSSVDVDWKNGPSRDMVQAVTSKYQYGHFDSMTDCYEMSNVNGLPQVKYVMESREINNETQQRVFQWLRKTHKHFDCITLIDESSSLLMDYWSVWTARDYISRFLRDKDLTDGLVLEGE